MKKKTIKGNIIRILDEETVIINMGLSQGIDEGKVFNILGKPEEIFDPISKTVLGTINVVKAKVKATQVYEKFTIAKSSWLEVNTGVFGRIIPQFDYKELGSGKMNVDQKDIQPWKAKTEEKIIVGDVVETEVDVEEKNKGMK